MTIYSIFQELDRLTVLNFGNLTAALEDERGKYLMEQLLSDENIGELREWYRSRPVVNDLAKEMKEILEKAIGTEL